MLGAEHQCALLIRYSFRVLSSISFPTQVYLLHKSLSDWLLKPGHRHSPDVDRGHKKLGLSLLTDVWAASHRRTPSEYCMKYTVLHLVKAGPTCLEMLQVTLSNWDFLRSCIRSKHGGRLLVALSKLPKGNSDYAEDTFRWLSRCLGRFEQDPERLEALTMIHCPLTSIKFKEAVAVLKCAWAPRMQLGGYGSTWPLDFATLLVSPSLE